ncbi:bactericidal permeability-increasing protein isoform X2 [Amia ocellicauda]
MRITKFNLPEPSAEFTEGQGIMAAMSGLNVQVHGNWNTHYTFIRDSGTFDVALYGMHVSLLLSPGTDDTGHLSLSSQQCVSGLNDVDVHFYGGASFIFSLFLGSIKGRIMSEVQQKLCPMVNDAVGGFDTVLQNMKVSVQINPNILVEVPLLSTPIVGDSDMELSLKGEFYSVRTHAEPPFPAGQFSLPPDSSRMLSLGVSEFCVNSAAFAYLSAGLLQVNITDNMLPKGSPLRLNTSSFGMFVPQLPKQFPDMLMLVQAFASQPPRASFLPDNVMVDMSVAAKFFAIQPDASLAPLFTLEMEASFKVHVFISEEKLKGSVALGNLTLSLTSTEVGPFQTKSLESVLKTGIQLLVLPKVNANLTAGIPLPTTPSVSLVNPVLKVNQGFMTIATDTSYSP